MRKRKRKVVSKEQMEFQLNGLAHDHPTEKPLLSSEAERLLGLHAAWAELVSATGDLPELVAACLTSQPLANQLGTGPLWILLVGVPSSSKSQAVAPARQLKKHVCYLDTLTEHSFISGYIPETGTPQDLLNELKGQALVVKELSSLLSAKEETVKKVLGDLCAIYDGSFSKFTGTRGFVSYESAFPFLGCVTPQIMERHSRQLLAIPIQAKPTPYPRGC